MRGGRIDGGIPKIKVSVLLFRSQSEVPLLTEPEPSREVIRGTKNNGEV